MKQKTTIAYIRWFDSCIGMETVPSDEEFGSMENESSGILVAEDKKTVTIALDRCIETKNLRMYLCIPRENIRSVKKFVTSSS